MNTYKFKTNINCSNCIKAVTPFLNSVTAIKEWYVDTDNPDKILTVTTDDFDDVKIISLLKTAGYNAEIMKLI